MLGLLHLVYLLPRSQVNRGACTSARSLSCTFCPCVLACIATNVHSHSWSVVDGMQGTCTCARSLSCPRVFARIAIIASGPWPVDDGMQVYWIDIIGTLVIMFSEASEMYQLPQHSIPTL